jgi:hypothetical protein
VTGFTMTSRSFSQPSVLLSKIVLPIIGGLVCIASNGVPSFSLSTNSNFAKIFNILLAWNNQFDNTFHPSFHSLPLFVVVNDFWI